MDHNPENHINSKKRTSTYMRSENQDEELAKKKSCNNEQFYYPKCTFLKLEN